MNPAQPLTPLLANVKSRQSQDDRAALRVFMTDADQQLDSSPEAVAARRREREARRDRVLALIGRELATTGRSPSYYHLADLLNVLPGVIANDCSALQRDQLLVVAEAPEAEAGPKNRKSAHIFPTELGWMRIYRFHLSREILRHELPHDSKTS
jgi:hypothetical protein